jgi:hypothetical protein
MNPEENKQVEARHPKGRDSIDDYVVHPDYIRRWCNDTHLVAPRSSRRDMGEHNPVHVRGKYIGDGKITDTNVNMNAFVWKTLEGIEGGYRVCDDVFRYQI